MGLLDSFFGKKEVKKPAATPPPKFTPWNEANHNFLKLSGFFEGKQKKGVPVGYAPYLNSERNKMHVGEKLYYTSDLHIVTFGATGSGKNTRIQSPALFEYEGSALVVDVKGQLAVITGMHRAVALEQDVFFINPFDVLGLPTATYNPLKYLDPDSPTFESDCRRIAEGLVDVKKADHWEISALDLVTLLIEYVVLYDDEKDLIRVRQLLNLSDEDRIVFFETMSGCPRPEIAEGAVRYTSDSKEVKDCIQTANVQLSFLRDSSISKVLKGGGNREVSFRDLKRKKATIYLIIPPELLHTHGRFLRLLVMSALGELFKEKTRVETPVLFMLDEFAQLGPMPIIENAASIVRDYQIKLWLILQNIPQLKTLYGQKWESFLSAAGLIQFLGVNDLETAKYISDRCGKTLQQRANQNTAITKGGGNSSITESYSFSTVEVPAITIKTVLEAPPQQLNMFTQGKGVSYRMITTAIPYYENMEYQSDFYIVIGDPYHMSDEERAATENYHKSSKCLFTNKNGLELARDGYKISIEGKVQRFYYGSF